LKTYFHKYFQNTSLFYIFKTLLPITIYMRAG